jgi:chemotaxis protein MotB
MAELEQPIIIKKIYKSEDGHHGGAWKVAYADFVTAMMAFFLLLWLLSSASKGQLESIAEYFTPTIGLKDALGIGFEGGTTDSEEGKLKKKSAKPNIVAAAPPEGIKVADPKKKAIIDSPEGEAMIVEKAASAINQAIADNEEVRDLAEHIMMQQKPEGLSIQLMDTDKEPMFVVGSTRLSKTGERILAAIVPVLKDVPNHISVTGHTDGVAFTGRREYSNWELSSDRANAARRHLVKSGLKGEQIGKVQGLADRELLYPDFPKDAKNRRIEIILLKGDHMKLHPTDRTAPLGAFPVNDKEDDVLQFEKKQPKKLPSLPVDIEQKKPNSPVTIVPDRAIERESLSNEAVLEFSP